MKFITLIATALSFASIANATTFQCEANFDRTDLTVGRTFDVTPEPFMTEGTYAAEENIEVDGRTLTIRFSEFRDSNDLPDVYAFGFSTHEGSELLSRSNLSLNEQPKNLLLSDEFVLEGFKSAKITCTSEQ